MADYTPKATITLKSKASMPTTSLDQQRAAYAWQCVQNVPNDYDKLAKAAPALIMNNGLMQALAFYQDKGKTKEGVMDRYHALNVHLMRWLGRQFGGNNFPAEQTASFDTVMPALIAVNVWKMFPFVALMVLAGLQAVPETLYEAARVDGANLWQEIRFVMLPQLRLVLASVTLILTIWGFNGITIIYTMTRGGPANRSLITPIQIFKQAFEFLRFSEAAALSVLLFAFLALLTLAYLRIFRAASDE